MKRLLIGMVLATLVVECSGADAEVKCRNGVFVGERDAQTKSSLKNKLNTKRRFRVPRHAII